MRMLFTFAGGTGHFLPTLPIARAASARGHQIVYGAQPMMLGNVEAAGFSAIDSGGPTMMSPSERRPLLPVDRAAEELVIRHSFAGRIAQERAGRLLDIASQWKPDVIIRDEVDFGAAVAAERLGIPHVSIIVLAAGGLVRADLVAEPLDALRAEHGLAPDPDLAMLHRHLTIAPVPRSYRSPSDPLPTAAHHVRPDVLDGRSPAADRPSTVTDWLAEHSDRPTVYFTLGTIFHQESGDLFTRVITALAGLTANVIVTCGNEIDPAELGGQPANVRIERFVPQKFILPRCDVVVSHAGSGSVIGALAFGVPLVLLPMGADQPLNADRCESLGVACVLDPITAGPKDIRRAVTAVLRTPGYRHSAERIRDETLALPDSEHAVILIEQVC